MFLGEPVLTGARETKNSADRALRIHWNFLYPVIYYIVNDMPIQNWESYTFCSLKTHQKKTHQFSAQFGFLYAVLK